MSGEFVKSKDGTKRYYYVTLEDLRLQNDALQQQVDALVAENGRLFGVIAASAKLLEITPPMVGAAHRRLNAALTGREVG